MRILWIKTELLHPIDKGGKIRTYQMLKQIRRDHDVTYLSFTTPNESEAIENSSEYCHRLVKVPSRQRLKSGARFYCDLLLNLNSPLPYAIEKYQSSAMQCAIELEVLQRHYDVAVFDFLAAGINRPPELGIPSVLFQHNVESTIWRRHFETQTSRIRRQFFYRQWQKMYACEREICRSFDAVVAVSKADRDQLRNEFGLREVHDVPTGVDTEYFRPLGSSPEAFELVFTGSMDWMPNEDAILYFAREILPRIEQTNPAVTLTIVGRNPSRRLAALAASNQRIKVTGRVEDVRPYVDRATAYIVPLRVGGGTRLKIYEAMAMEKPVISTSVGAEGLPVRDGDELLIADDPDEFAEAVSRVLTDARLANRLGKQARKVVCERFGWKHAADRFIEICARLAQKHTEIRAA